MRRIISVILPLAILFAVTSCKMSSVEWAELEDIVFDPNGFVPFSSSEDEFDEQALKSCSLPGGGCVGDVIEEETKTTSTNGLGIFSNLISSSRNKRIRSYCGSYWSTDVNGELIKLSGRIVLPADGKVSRIMVVSHFTIAADYEAPSSTVTMESLFAARGLAVIEADYLGYGITSDKVHPYLCASVTAKNVVDMYYAALPFLQKIGCKPKYPDIFLLGYSQGGAVTMSVAHEFEFHHFDDVKIRLIMAGGGPYDICATYDTLVDNDYTDIPCAIPLIIQGMDVGMGLNLDYSKFFVPHVAKNLDKWLNTKQYTVAQVTEMIGSHHISDMLTPAAQDKAKDLMTDLYRAMVDNSVTNEMPPAAPLYLFHSIDDNVVPFVNAINLQEKMVGMNVTYNIGHYGSHQMGCLRFMYSCLDLLKRNGDIENIF